LEGLYTAKYYYCAMWSLKGNVSVLWCK